MQKLLNSTNRTDKILTISVSAMSLIRAALFIVIIWVLGDFPKDARFFIVFFSFYSGAKIAVCAMLITGDIFSKFGFKRVYLLLVSAALDAANIIANIVFYSVGFGSFWLDGYIFMLFDASVIAVCLHRYFYQRKARAFFRDMPENKDAD